MRPVNLIPADDRRGESAPARTGLLAYAIVGVLVAALGVVAALTLTSKQISDREAEVAALETEEAELQARAAGLQVYTQFQALKSDREKTISQLAETRFDWERVMQELSLILPKRVWLTTLTGTVDPGVSPPGGSSLSARAAISGPALEMAGCARSQRDVARLVAALEDIDGVTRVLATKGDKGGGSGAGGECKTRDFVAEFEAIAAFDAVVAGTGDGTAPPPPPDGEEATPADGSVGDAQATDAGTEQAVGEASDSANEEANLAAGG